MGKYSIVDRTHPSGHFVPPVTFTQSQWYSLVEDAWLAISKPITATEWTYGPYEWDQSAFTILYEFARARKIVYYGRIPKEWVREIHRRVRREGRHAEEVQ